MTKMKSPPDFSTSVFVEATTNAAILIKIEGREVWLPKSQIECGFPKNEFERGQVYDIRIPSWLAKKSGLMV